jgi:hypothetical protein
LGSDFNGDNPCAGGSSNFGEICNDYHNKQNSGIAGIIPLIWTYDYVSQATVTLTITWDCCGNSPCAINCNGCNTVPSGPQRTSNRTENLGTGYEQTLL